LRQSDLPLLAVAKNYSAEIAEGFDEAALILRTE
jgi:hypothetical protein